MVGQIYPTELQLNKANSSDTKAPFLDLNLSITNGIVSSKIYDKRDDFNFRFNLDQAVSAILFMCSIQEHVLVTFPIFKNRTYFSVTSIVVKGVNVSGGNVIKPFA